MKRCLLLLCLTLTMVACSKEDVKDEETIVANNPLPKEPKELKILAIGNSFTEDATQYLPSLLSAAHIKNVTIARLMNGNLSLENHWTYYTSNASNYYFQKSDPETNMWKKVESNYTISKAISDEKWDIIVLQQVSFLAGKYDSYQPHLNKMLNALRHISMNNKVTFAWQMTWAYAKNCTETKFSNYNNNQLTMYKAIASATQLMKKGSGIDIIIPSGTAIQNLRNTIINNNPYDLTRDGCHSDLGAGRYVEACTWFLTLIKPCLQTYTIEGNTYRPTEGKVPVTNNNVELIWKAAEKAIQDPYEISALN